MLSQKKIVIAQKEIEFLGMHFKDGFYYLGKHIAKELLKFSHENLYRKQVHQFLGIVNYLRYFVPKILKLTHSLLNMLKNRI